MKTYVLASGGTGGHVYPAVSLASALKGNCILITDQRGVKFCNSADFAKIYVQKLFYYFGIKKIIFYANIVKSIIKCILLFRKIKPDLVIGFGGYPSFASVIAAQILKIPNIIHEQNVKLGKANRVLATRATAIATSYDSTLKLEKVTCTGNPVRKFIRNTEPCDNKLCNKNNFNILVLGGSQGAKIFARVIPPAIAELPVQLQQKINITQQCRADDTTFVSNIYNKLPLKKFETPNFIHDIAKYYANTDLIITRAGASTIAEIVIHKLPALLVPYAASAEGDQYFNSMHLYNNDAAWLMEEVNFTVANLKNFLINTLDEAKLVEKSINLSKFYIKDAEQKLANLCYKIIEEYKC